MKVYSGYYKDCNKVLCSSSGGVATALSEAIIEKGGSVFGVRYTADFYNVEYCCIDNKNGLARLKGSKYIHANVSKIFDELSNRLASGRIVLFIGLGCDIAAINNYCCRKNLDTSNLYTVDILCHGPALNDVHAQYIDVLEKQYSSKIVDFTIRYKKDAWTPFYIKAHFENGKQLITPFNDTDYGKAFRYVAIPACTDCKFKGNNHTGDLCVGDYWGLTSKMSGWNPNGVSIMIVQTEKGSKLLDFLGSDFYMQEEDEDFVLKGNPMYSQSRVQRIDYNEFVSDLKNNGLHYAVSKLPKEAGGITKKLKKIIKHIVKQVTS